MAFDESTLTSGSGYQHLVYGVIPVSIFRALYVLRRPLVTLRGLTPFHSWHNAPEIANRDATILRNPRPAESEYANLRRLFCETEEAKIGHLHMIKAKLSKIQNNYMRLATNLSASMAERPLARKIAQLAEQILLVHRHQRQFHHFIKRAVGIFDELAKRRDSDVPAQARDYTTVYGRLGK